MREAKGPPRVNLQDIFIAGWLRSLAGDRLDENVLIDRRAAQVFSPAVQPVGLGYGMLGDDSVSESPMDGFGIVTDYRKLNLASGSLSFEDAVGAELKNIR